MGGTGLFAFDLATALSALSLALVLMVSMGVLVRALWPPADLMRRSVCGGCGHGVSDALQSRCPECGGLYARVGISTPLMAVRLRASLPLALLAWTAVCAILAGFLNQQLANLAWRRFQTQSMTATFGTATVRSYHTEFRPQHLQWRSGDGISGSQQLEEKLAFRIALATNITTSQDSDETGTAELTLRRDGSPHPISLTIDLTARSFKVQGPQATVILASVGEIDDAVVQAWFKAAELDVEHEAVKVAMEDAGEIARLAMNDPSALEHRRSRSPANRGKAGALESSGSSSSSGPVAGVVPLMPTGPSTIELAAAALTVGAVYLVGLVFILRRHRELVTAR